MGSSYSPTVVRRSWKRRAARWVVVTLIGAFVVTTIWNLVRREWIRVEGNRELAAAVAETERDDPDWTWEKVNAARKFPPAGQNSAELIPQIKKLSHADWGKWQAAPEWAARREDPANVRYSSPVIADVRRDVTASAEAIKLARTLKDYPNGNREIVLKPDVLSTLLDDTQHTRHVADLLRWDIVLAVEDGHTQRAADDLLALLNASRSIGDEPFMISQLVRMAVRSVAVRNAEWVLAQVTDPPTLAELQAALAEDAEEPLLLYGLRGDRASFDRLFENLDSGTVDPSVAIDSGFNNAWSRIGWWYYRAHLPADRGAFLKWMSMCVEFARLPIHAQPAAIPTIIVPAKDPRRLLSGLLLPAVDRVANAYWRTTAEERCAVASIACERFRQKHKRWPTDLAELSPVFLVAVPLDPYDGQPLRYRKLDDGVIVHSVGAIPQPEFVAKQPTRPGLPDGIEIGFRLWNPEARRLPPRPDAELP